MHRRRAAAISTAMAGLVAVLSACSGPDSGASSTPDSPGYGKEFSQSRPSVRDREGTDNSPPRPNTDFTLPDSTNPLREDSRGRLVKGLGDLAGVILRNDPSQRLVNFSVDSITADYRCPANPELRPQHGHFIAVHLQVEALPALANSQTPYFGVSAKDFDVESASGAANRDSLDTWAAHACLDDGSGLPAKIGAGEKYQGTVVLDAPTRDGSVVLSQRKTEGPGWVWRIPVEGGGDTSGDGSAGNGPSGNGPSGGESTGEHP